ncbi:MAG TPA: glycosyltransferase family A protein [Nitrososphaera sp.]|nr:glycosyltransferase family A protein [Nitrososphaera sp.]
MGSYFAIMTCRNSEDNIKEALLSLKAQTVPPSYVIVVDDGSKDGTASILRHLQQSSWPSLYVITNPDLGYNIARVVSNWNKAIQYAHDHGLPRTDYHMICADDTSYERDYAEIMMRHMDADSKIAIASGNYEDKRTIAPHGAGRFVRTEFFDVHHGLYPEKMGYESLVLYSATHHGYYFSVFNDARFEHTRPLGKNHHFYEFGASMRTLGYHPLFALGRFILYFASGKPTGRLGALYMLYYYLSYKPKDTGYDSMHDSEMRRYIRNYQFARIKKKLGIP